MRSHEIEAWALRVIEQAKAGERSEDFRAELKSKWPATDRTTARWIAGLANASRGEPVLWVVGVDDKTGEVCGAAQEELANWWPAVQKYFDEIAPRLTDLNVPVDGKTVVALLFETDRLPFVYRRDNDFLEVPWREGTRTRSAKRSELLRMLTPSALLPEVEVLRCRLAAPLDYHQKGHLVFAIELFIAPPVSSHELTIPYHWLAAEVQVGEKSISEFRLWRTVVGAEYTRVAFRLLRPEIVDLGMCFEGNPMPSLEGDARLRLEFGVVHSDRPIVVHQTLPQAEADGSSAAVWLYGQGSDDDHWYA